MLRVSKLLKTIYLSILHVARAIAWLWTGQRRSVGGWSVGGRGTVCGWVGARSVVGRRSVGDGSAGGRSWVGGQVAGSGRAVWGMGIVFSPKIVRIVGW